MSGRAGGTRSIAVIRFNLASSDTGRNSTTFTLIEKLQIQKDAGGAVQTEWNAAIDRCIQIIREHDPALLDTQEAVQPTHIVTEPKGIAHG